jgi:CRISPR-associated protein Cmr4
MNTQLTFVHALSPLHAGIGQGVGVIDLPIAREKATGLPFLPGSSLKGALRARCDDPKICIQVFGPDTTGGESDYPSSVQFSDQRLLLLPIRSLAGTFAWVTSPYILRRFIRDMRDVQIGPATTIPVPESEEHCCIAQSDSKITMATTKVYLEDLDLVVQDSPDVKTWATWIGERVFPGDATWQQMLIERFCVVHDDALNFLIDTATEITARIKLKEDTKTVQSGGLWYEEALPTETILSGLALTTPVKASQMTPEKVLSTLIDLTKKPVQLGGKATVGRGICRVQMVQGGA